MLLRKMDIYSNYSNYTQLRALIFSKTHTYILFVVCVCVNRIEYGINYIRQNSLNIIYLYSNPIVLESVQNA